MKSDHMIAHALERVSSSEISRAFGQDARTWEELLSLLAGLRDAGRAICFATHDRDFARALADRTLHLRLPQGEAVAR